MVGLVLDDKHVAWGTCVPPGYGGPAESPEYFEAAEGIKTIRNTVAPVLEGQRVSSFRELAAEIDGLTELATVTRPVTQAHSIQLSESNEADGLQMPQVSRRDLLRGQFWTPPPADEAEPIVEQFTAEQPIAATIRYGLSQALLAATAMAQDVTMAEVILSEYGLPRPDSIVPIHTVIKSGQPASLERPIASLGYSVAGVNSPAELGDEGQKLQRFARQLGERISAAADQASSPAIHLNVRGGLGHLFDNNSGKILGALYGLQQAAAPHLVRVEDPLATDSRQEQIENMTELKNYVRLRGMSLQLVAGLWLNHLEDVEAFVQAEAAHMIHLEMPRLGALDKTIEAIMACKERGISLLLVGAPAGVAAQVALATQPDLVSAPSDRPGNMGAAVLYNEMARTLAWISRSPGHGGRS